MRERNDNGNVMMIALVGGAIGAAAALFFSDEKRRKALKDVFADLNARSGEIPGRVQEMTTELSKRAQELTGGEEREGRSERGTRKNNDSK